MDLHVTTKQLGVFCGRHFNRPNITLKITVAYERFFKRQLSVCDRGSTATTQFFVNYEKREIREKAPLQLCSFASFASFACFVVQ